MEYIKILGKSPTNIPGLFKFDSKYTKTFKVVYDEEKSNACEETDVGFLYRITSDKKQLDDFHIINLPGISYKKLFTNIFVS